MQQQIQDFINQQLAESTKKNYKVVLKRFMTWCDGKIPEGEDWIGKYKIELKNKNLGNSTINYNFIVIGRFLQCATHKTINYERLKVAPSQVEFLTDDEINKLYKHADKEFEAVLRIMLDTGMRVNEFSEFSRRRFDNIPREAVITGKGGKQRLIVLSEATESFLRGVWREGLVCGRSWSVASVQRKLKALAKDAGITKNVHPHMLRHTFATHMLWNGAAITEVQQMLGHSHITTTQIYTHVTEDRLRKVWADYHQKSKNRFA